MDYIVLGCLAFILFYIFDLNKIKFRSKYINICFGAGLVILGFCTFAILVRNYELMNSHYQLIWGIMAIISLILMLSTLFFWLPFDKTYIRTEQSNVVSTGMYALCRHPAVIWFFFFYLFLWLTSGNIMVLWAGTTWTVMDIIYVYIQDRWIFPLILTGYTTYQQKVPFLIPNINSIKNCIATIYKVNP